MSFIRIPHPILEMLGQETLAGSVDEAGTRVALLVVRVDTISHGLDRIKWGTREPGMVKTAMPEIAQLTKRLIAIMEGERPEAMEDWL